MEPNEDAVMNMALFQTEEMFKERVRAVLIDLLHINDGQINVALHNHINSRLMSFRESLANNIASAIRQTY
jgi:hypothetical protein